MNLRRLRHYFFNKLDIRHEEDALVSYSLLLSFAIGLVQCYLYTSSLALFLVQFGSKSLPQLYFSLAIILLIFSYVYTAFSGGKSASALTFVLVIFLGIITVFFGVILIKFDYGWNIYLLACWGGLVQLIFNFKLWDFFNQIYTLEQAKRLYGIFSASKNIGSIVAGISLSILLLFVTNEEVILLSAACFLLILSLFRKLFRYADINDTLGDEILPEKIKSPSLTVFIKNNYLFKLALLVILAVFSLRIVDLLFNTVVVERFRQGEDLASFLGLFLALVSASRLLINLFLFKLLLIRLGLIVSTMLLPITVFGFSVLLAISYVSTSLFLFFFALIFLFQVCERLLRDSIFEVSYLFYLHPLHSNLRSFCFAKIDMIIMPFAHIFGSGMLFIYLKCYSIVSLPIIFLLMIFSGLSIFIISRLKTNYFSVLATAISNRYALPYVLEDLNKDQTIFFQRFLTSSNEVEVINALTCIEKISKTSFYQSLEMVLNFNNNSIVVKRFLLEKIREYQFETFALNLSLKLDEEKNIGIKSLLLITLAELNFKILQPKLAVFLTSKIFRLRHAAILVSLKYAETGVKKYGLDEVKDMLHSSHARVRSFAIFLLKEGNCFNELNIFLPSLLRDKSPLVKQQVFLAMVKHMQNLEENTLALVPSLESRVLREKKQIVTKNEMIEKTYLSELLAQIELLSLTKELIADLKPFSATIMLIIKENFSSYSINTQKRLFYLLGQMQPEWSRDFLQEQALKKQIRDLELAVLQALLALQGRPSAHFRNQYLIKINELIAKLKEESRDLAVIPKHELTLLLRDVLKEKQAQSIEHLFLSFALFYGRNPMLSIKLAFETGNPDKISYAFELLEKVLSKEHRRELRPILIGYYYFVDNNKARLNSKEFQRVIRRYLKYEDQEISSLLFSLSCLYIIKGLGQEEFSQELEELKRSHSIHIQETLVWLNAEA